MNGSVRGTFAAAGEFARDHQRIFWGAFSNNLGESNILRVQLLAIMYALEEVNRRGWSNV